MGARVCSDVATRASPCGSGNRPTRTSNSARGRSAPLRSVNRGRRLLGRLLRGRSNAGGRGLRHEPPLPTSQRRTFRGSASSPNRELYVEHSSRRPELDDGVKLDGVSVLRADDEPRRREHLHDRAHRSDRNAGLRAARGIHQLPEHGLPDSVGEHDVSADTSIYVSFRTTSSTRTPDCGENDPNSPNYRSCVGVSARPAATVITTTSSRIISGGGTHHTLTA